MDFTQPTEEITTNKTQAENKKLVDIRNQVTILEGESIRLRELIHAEKYEVGELVKQKRELTDALPDLLLKRDSIGDEIAALTANLAVLEERRVQVNKEVDSALKITEEAQAKYLEVIQDLDIKRETLEKAQKDIAAQKELLAIKEAELNDKLNQLRKIVI